MKPHFIKIISVSVLAASTMLAVNGGGGGGGTPVNVCAYNVFSLGNLTAQYSDIQGAVAAGGNATFTGYSVGQNLPANPAAYSIVAGGTVSFTNGQVVHGSVVANGGLTLQGVSVLNGSVISGGTITLTNGQINGTQTPNQLSPEPINFATAGTYLRGASNFYATIPANGTVTNNYGGLVLQGYSSTLNVFSVSASTLASVWGVEIIVPTGSTVLVNVSGTSATVPNVGYNYQGTDATHVLYNFSQATSLTIAQGQGTILAPLAAASFPWGVVNGTIVVNSFTGNGQSNVAGFVGVLPGLPTNPPLCH